MGDYQDTHKFQDNDFPCLYGIVNRKCINYTNSGPLHDYFLPKIYKILRMPNNHSREACRKIIIGGQFFYINKTNQNNT